MQLFVLVQVDYPSGSNTVEYLVVAGGGGGGGPGRSGGGGGGGYRFASCFSVTAQGYPITVGGGGAVGLIQTYPTSMEHGNNS